MNDKSPGKTYLEAFNELVDSLLRLYSPAESKEIARRLTEHVSEHPFTWVLAHPAAFMGLEKEKRWNKCSKRLIWGEPIQYVTSKAWFYGFPFYVKRGVTLIPRPETEELADWIIQEYKERRGIRFLDVGTGSGCLAVTLALHFDCQAYAMDNSEAALEVADENAEKLESRVYFRHLDLFEAGPEEFENLHFIVSNPPYVRESEKAGMHRNVLAYEPPEALFVPDYDALRYYKMLAIKGKMWLKKGGFLYLEFNEAKAAELKELLESEGYGDIVIKKDMQGKDRMMRAQWGQVPVRTESEEGPATPAEKPQPPIQEDEEEGHFE